MSLNQYASTAAALDMTLTEEFQSLLQSAADLQIPHIPNVRYESRSIVVRHLRFNVLDWGPRNAPVIFCLHGGHQSAHSWDLVSLSLAEKYRVITPDQRGHGDSEWSRNCEYSTEDMAEDAAALITELDIDQPIVIGHSMGGSNAMTMLLAHPQIAKALVVVDIGPEISDRGRQAISSFVAANEEFEDLDAFVANVRAYDPYRSREHIERTVKYNLFKRADGKYVSKCDRAPRKLGLLPDSKCVKLDLGRGQTAQNAGVGAAWRTSNILTEDAASRFEAALSNATKVTVPSCGHNVHSQNTKGFLNAIEPFLAAQTQAPNRREEG